MDGRESGDDEKDELTLVGWEECEGDLLVWSCLNEAESWFLRYGDAYQ